MATNRSVAGATFTVTWVELFDAIGIDVLALDRESGRHRPDVARARNHDQCDRGGPVGLGGEQAEIDRDEPLVDRRGRPCVEVNYSTVMPGGQATGEDRVGLIVRALIAHGDRVGERLADQGRTGLRGRDDLQVAHALDGDIQLARLLEGFGSACWPAMEAESVKVEPGDAVGFTTIVRVADSPTPRLPNVTATTLPAWVGTTP